MVPLKEILEKRFGKGFPVGEGSTKKDDPLVITDQRDYVSIEYAIAKFLLQEMGLEYKFDGQRTHNMNGRVVDELTYAAKEPGEPDWTETRRFFFDITAGFKRIGQNHQPSSPVKSASFKFLNVLIGSLAGFVIGIAWLGIAWVWGKWGLRFVTAYFASDPRGGPAPIVLDLVPVALGALFFIFSISLAAGLISDFLGSRSSPKFLAWPMAVVCMLFALIYASFMWLMAYYSSGFVGGLLAFYGLLFLAIPSGAAFWAAKKVSDSAA